MRKTIFILIFIMLFSSFLFAEENFDFRRIKWGMTKQEVMLSEGIDTYEI